MKKYLAMFLAVLMLVSVFALCVSAEESSTFVTPRWAYILGVEDVIGFNGSLGEYGAEIVCMSSVTRITGTATLYQMNIRGNWNAITTWEYDETGDSLSILENFNAVSGREYKVQLDATIYAGSFSETVSKTVTKTCP